MFLSLFCMECRGRGAMSATLTDSPSSPSATALNKERERSFSSAIGVLHISTPSSSFNFELTRTRTIIGRADQVCDCLITNPIVSKQHLALFCYSSGTIFAEDLGSANGTFLETTSDGASVPLGKGKQVQVLVGQTLLLGEHGKVRIIVAELRLDVLRQTNAPAAVLPQSAACAATLLEVGGADDDDDDVAPPPAASAARVLKMSGALETQLEATPTRAGLLDDDETPPLPVAVGSRKGTAELLHAASNNTPSSILSFVVSPRQENVASSPAAVASAKLRAEAQHPSCGLGDASSTAAGGSPPSLAVAATLLVNGDEDDLPPPPANVITPAKRELDTSVGSVASSDRPPKAARREKAESADPIGPQADASLAPTTSAALPVSATPAPVTSLPRAVPVTPPPVASVQSATGTVVWQFKIDLRKVDTKEDAWEDYSAADNAIIEAAHAALKAAKKPRKTQQEVKLTNATYGIHFGDMVQFRFDDRSRQRPVRRIVK